MGDITRNVAEQKRKHQKNWTGHQQIETTETFRHSANNIQHNKIQHNNTQRRGLICDTQQNDIHYK